MMKAKRVEYNMYNGSIIVTLECGEKVEITPHMYKDMFTTENLKLQQSNNEYREINHNLLLQNWRLKDRIKELDDEITRLNDKVYKIAKVCEE